MIPERPAVARVYRAPLARLERHIWVPRVQPVVWSVVGVAVSALAFAASTDAARVAIVVVALLADWLDGATARRYGGVSRRGYIRDVLADRISEGLLFLAAPAGLVREVFLALWLANVALSAYSVTGRRHLALPLRFAYLVALAVGLH